jgi:hypothetical protein
MAEAAGYRVAFTRVRMELPLSEPAPVVLPAGLELRAASTADHRAVFDANARASRPTSPQTSRITDSGRSGGTAIALSDG